MIDTIIKNGTIVDGTASKAYIGDIAIEGDVIKEIGQITSTGDAKLIDATGCVVSPGFIDVHSHADLTIYREDHDQMLEPLVRQGITTFIGGNCGMSLAPIGDRHKDLIQQYLEAFTAFDFSKEIIVVSQN